MIQGHLDLKVPGHTESQPKLESEDIVFYRVSTSECFISLGMRGPTVSLISPSYIFFVTVLQVKLAIVYCSNILQYCQCSAIPRGKRHNTH